LRGVRERGGLGYQAELRGCVHALAWVMHRVRDMRTQALALEPLRARLPSFWWSEVSRIQQLIAEDAEAATFEAAYLEYAAEALAQAEDDLLAHQHAPALWAASHQLKATALAQLRRQAKRKARAAS
jgi:hypothetical protein